MRLKSNRRFDGVLVAVSILTISEPTYAYLDPGTGSMLLSVVVGLVSSAYFFARRLPSLIRSLFFRLRGQQEGLKHNSIVFYSESKSYWQTFRPVLKHLVELGIRPTYLTSDENDPVFTCEFKDKVFSRFIGKGNSAYTALGFLEADCFVLTTPGIDVLQIRRSSGVKHYVHLVHAVGDIHTYKFYSFDYYDAVYCAAPGQAASLRELESKRHTKAKDLPLLGCPYLDAMVERARTEAVVPDAKTVLVAPTWGPNGLLRKTEASIPLALAKAGFHVIVRPHPQSFVSEPDLMQRIESTIAGISSIEFDRNPDGFASLSRASVMVSDISGVMFDFAFVFLRPIVAVGPGPLKDGFEAWELDSPAWEQTIIPEIGKRRLEANTEEILSDVKELAAARDSYAKAIESVRDANIANFGCAGKPIADALAKLLVH